MHSWRILLFDVSVDKQLEDRWRVRVRMSVPRRAEALPGTSDMGTHVQYVPTLRSSQSPTMRSLGHQIVLEEDAGVAGPDVVAHLVPVQVSASHGAAHTAMARLRSESELDGWARMGMGMRQHKRDVALERCSARTMLALPASPWLSQSKGYFGTHHLGQEGSTAAFRSRNARMAGTTSFYPDSTLYNYIRAKPRGGCLLWP